MSPRALIESTHARRLAATLTYVVMVMAGALACTAGQGNGADPTPTAAVTPTATRSVAVGDIVDGGEEVVLGIGQAVRVADGAGNVWTVRITDAEWLDEGCGPLGGGGEGPIVVIDIHIEVLSGLASPNGFLEFTFVDDEGSRGRPLLNACDERVIDGTTEVSAGQSHSGEIAFVVGSGRGGDLAYLVGEATWIIPGD